MVQSSRIYNGHKVQRLKEDLNSKHLYARAVRWPINFEVRNRFALFGVPLVTTLPHWNSAKLRTSPLILVLDIYSVMLENEVSYSAQRICKLTNFVLKIFFNIVPPNIFWPLVIVYFETYLWKTSKTFVSFQKELLLL